MILIHCAMLSEAQYIIEKLKLVLLDKNPRIYTNNNIILVVSGIGKENTLKSLSLVYKSYDIKKAINIGIAGCSDKSINIGELFCTTHKLKNIKFMELQTVDTPQIENKDIMYLYDMEASYFKKFSLGYLHIQKIYIYKIVSDYLDDSIPKKEFVKQLIKTNIDNVSFE